jgi:hypothetical protein
MKLTRPIIKEPTATKPLADEKQIGALIEKGGSSVAVEQPADEDEKQQVRLVAYTSQLREIEEVLQRMPKRGRPSRHAWILKAIDEKLEREKKRRK